MHLESVTTQNAQIWGDATMSFGERVRDLRTKQGMTAKDLSAKSGVPEKTIYRIETGEVEDPRLSTVEPLVKALNCTADEILFEVESFNGDQRLRKLFEATSRTSKGNQELIVRVITQLNLADTLRWEIIRDQVEQMIDNPSFTNENRERLRLEDLELPADAVEYFRKHPDNPKYSDGD